MATTYMRFPGGKSRCLTLSYDDGVVQDTRFIETIKKYGLRATFNLNSGAWADKDYEDGKTAHRRLTLERAKDLYTNSGFEVAVHGVTHPWLEQLPVNVCTAEILKDRISLERDFKQIVRGSAYPFGTYNKEVFDSLRACGIVYCRTVHSTYNFYLPDNWLALNPTCHHADPKLMELCDQFFADQYSKAPRFFYVWGHTYEFDWNDNWDILDRFAERVSNQPDVWYATNIEAYDYIQAYKSLVFNTDLTMAHNPSAQTVYFATDTQSYEIAPGATITLL